MRGNSALDFSKSASSFRSLLCFARTSGLGASEAIKLRIAQIAALFPQPAPLQPPQFPRTFSLVEQGRFALGFYQQKAADDAARKEARNNKTQTQLVLQPEVETENTPALPGF